MRRPILWMVLILLSGCRGESGSPRFVPAKGDASSASTVDRKPSADVSIPKNIPMH